MTSTDWLKVADAAERISKKPRDVYRYLEKSTAIRRQRIGRNTYVHIPSLLEYEATVKPGRPAKT